MKPSNTGRDWYSDLRLWEVDAETDRYVGGDAINLIAEAAAQIAIAEYRKEAKAECQRELAARAEKRLTRYYPNGENDMGASDYGEYYERAEVLALINENDDA